MAIRGVRLQGQTFVRLEDVLALLRKNALSYVTELPGNPIAGAAASAIGSVATRLEKTFDTWEDKPDMVEFKKRNIV